MSYDEYPIWVEDLEQSTCLVNMRIIAKVLISKYTSNKYTISFVYSNKQNNNVDWVYNTKEERDKKIKEISSILKNKK